MLLTRGWASLEKFEQRRMSVNVLYWLVFAFTVAAALWLKRSHPISAGVLRGVVVFIMPMMWLFNRTAYQRLLHSHQRDPSELSVHALNECSRTLGLCAALLLFLLNAVHFIAR